MSEAYPIRRKFSSVLLLGEVITLIILGTDRIVIGLCVSVGAIAFYEVARRLHDIVYTASGLPISATLPAASELEAEKKSKALKKLIFRGGKYSTALIVGVSLIIILLAHPIIKYWMGEEFLVDPAGWYRKHEHHTLDGA